MITLALDVGEARIGMAVSDGLGLLARTAGVVERKDGLAIKTILEKLTTLEAQEIVIGLPLDLKGREGKAAEAVRHFGHHLQTALTKSGRDIPIHYFDERFTTKLADLSRLDSGMSKKRRRETTNDSAAAAILLQGWLDRRQNGAPPASR
jgi:putative Holliday junction resolvase